MLWILGIGIVVHLVSLHSEMVKALVRIGLARAGWRMYNQYTPLDRSILKTSKTQCTFHFTPSNLSQQPTFRPRKPSVSTDHLP
jgi:hypothetical protein